MKLSIFFESLGEANKGKTKIEDLFQLLKEALQGLSVQSSENLPEDEAAETIVKLTMTYQWPNQHPLQKRRFYHQLIQREKLQKTQIKKMT